MTMEPTFENFLPVVQVQEDEVAVSRGYEIKDSLRARGFRWDSLKRCVSLSLSPSPSPSHSLVNWICPRGTALLFPLFRIHSLPLAPSFSSTRAPGTSGTKIPKS